MINMIYTVNKREEKSEKGGSRKAQEKESMVAEKGQ